MPCEDGSRMWRERIACVLEQAADFDDLSILRVGKTADEFEAVHLTFVPGFHGVELVTPPEGGFY